MIALNLIMFSGWVALDCDMNNYPYLCSFVQTHFPKFQLTLIKTSQLANWCTLVIYLATLCCKSWSYISTGFWAYIRNLVNRLSGLWKQKMFLFQNHTSKTVKNLHHVPFSNVWSKRIQMCISMPLGFWVCTWSACSML